MIERWTLGRLAVAAMLAFGLAGAGQTALAASGDAKDPPPVGETLPNAPGEAPENYGLTYQTGKFRLRGNLASISTTAGFSFLDAANTRKLLVDLWGNPPGVAEGVLGAIVPTDIPINAANSWAAILYYDPSGHVSDDDAASIDYADLLRQMKEDTATSNEMRKEQGFETVELVGWAEPPHYDAAEHKIFWAQQLHFATSSEDTLNYYIRALGREGVLEMNVIASFAALPEIRKQTPALMKMVSFEDGQRYTDFNAATDEVAAFGLAGLVAGGIAAKTGLLKVLIGILAAGWKFIAIGAVAAIAGVRALFSRKA